MFVTMIHGQSHEQTSCHAGRLLVEKLENVSHVYEFFLPRDLPVFCNGCYLCMNKDASFCPHARYVQPISDAMDVSDILIFTTPVYCMHTTAGMKSLLDHLFVQWMSHRPKATMFHKKAVIISSGAGAGMRKAANDIKDSLQYWGISNTYVVTIRAQSTTWAEVKPEIRKTLYKKLDRTSDTLNQQQSNHVSLKIKLIFYMMRMMQLKNWSACEMDTQYWIKHHWIGKQRPWKQHE